MNKFITLVYNYVLAFKIDNILTELLAKVLKYGEYVVFLMNDEG